MSQPCNGSSTLARNARTPWQVDPQGWIPESEQLCSPHFNTRPPHTPINCLVIHCISLPAKSFGTPWVRDLFLGTLDCTQHPDFASLQNMRVSSHFLIERSGHVVQFVSCLDRAWHAGVSSFNGQENCNDFSIGIELEGFDTIPYEDAQYESLSKLTRALMTAFPMISKDRIVGHSDIAPGRKTDPGPAFDWTRYKRTLL